MKRPNERICHTCGNPFRPMSFNGLHCPPCQVELKRKRSRRLYDADKARAARNVSDEELVARMDAYLKAHAADTYRPSASPIARLAEI